MTRKPPMTEEGWYALHAMYSVDWDAWREAPRRRRKRAIESGVEFLREHEAVEDADAGDSAVYTMLGHEADLLVVHLRPAISDLDTAERAFENTAFAGFTEEVDSYVSVTEASGYTERAREYFEGEIDEDSGLAQYIQGRLHPEIPDDEFVCFYPMSKRRGEEHNWYDLPFEERVEHIERHGDIGRDYGSKVQQMISASTGFDDYEWGVTLWADDMTDVKDLLVEMRFDPSTSRFAEFGPFHVGRRFPPGDLEAVLNGDSVPTESESESELEDTGEAESGEKEEKAEEEGKEESDSSGGRPDLGGGDFEEAENIEERLAALGLEEGYGDGDYALVFYSDASLETVESEVSELAESFGHYDRHVLSTAGRSDGRTAAVSVWTAKEAAETAAGFLGDVAGVEEKLGGTVGET